MQQTQDPLSAREETARPPENVETAAAREEARSRSSMRRLRFQTGMAVLFTAMGAMIALVLFDAVFSMTSSAERALISNAFEAFKLIAVTVLGYIFGANQTKSDTDA